MRQRALGYVLLSLLTVGCSRDQPSSAPVSTTTPSSNLQPSASSFATAPSPNQESASAATPAQESTSSPKAEQRGSIPYLKLAGRQVALCVGVNEYKFRQKIESTRCGEANVKSLSKLLKDRYGFETEELTEDRATRSGFLDRLEQLGKELTDKDVLLVYFGGHGQVLEFPDGSRFGYLLPQDADLDLKEPTSPSRLRAMSLSETAALVKQWDERAINMKELVQRLGPVKAQHVVVIVDACFSGFMTHLGGPLSTDRTDLEELLRRQSRSVLAATTDNNLAIGPEEKSPHSLFTSELLKRLATDDPSALTEVFLDVRKKVAAATQAKPEQFRMLPQRGEFGGNGGEFVFVPASVAAVQMKPRVRNSIAKAMGQIPAVITITDILRAFAISDYHFGSHPIEQEREWKDKVGRYEVAASLGDSLSMAALHYCYSRGFGVTKNDAEAYRWAKKAFDTGRPEGKHVLGRCLLQGIGTDKNGVAANRLFRAAADAGFPLSDYTLAMGKMPSNRPVIMQDLVDIRPIVEKAANAGVAPAKTQLALLIANQPSPSKDDIDSIIRLFKEAVEAGDAKANFRLFNFYASGSPDRPKDLELARNTLQRGAEDGDPLCQLTLACEYFPKAGFPSYGSRPMLSLERDLAEAIKWGEMAASNNFDPALLYLAEIYQGGGDRPAQPEKAKEYCERAVKNGYARAIVRKGIWYLAGGLYEHDDKKAFACFQDAARMGDYMAYFHLSRMYENATGVDLRGNSRDSMKAVYLPHRIHCLVQSVILSKRQGITGNAAEQILGEIAPRVRLDTLNDLQALYPESHKVFMEAFRSNR